MRKSARLTGLKRRERGPQLHALGNGSGMAPNGRSLPLSKAHTGSMEPTRTIRSLLYRKLANVSFIQYYVFTETLVKQRNMY